MIRFLLLFFMTGSWLFAQQEGFRQYSVAEGLAQSQVFALLEDHQGYLWIGTQGGGVNRWDGRTFRRYSLAEGLGNAKINCLFQDSQKRIWLGTQQGLTRFDGFRFEHFSFQGRDLPVLSLSETPDGRLLAGTSQGLWEWQADSLSRLDLADGAVKSMAWTGDTLWTATSGGLLLFRDGKRLALPPGLAPSKPMEVVRTQQDGTLWAGAYGKEIFQLKKGRFQALALPWGSDLLVTDLAWTREGDMWVATQDQGAARWNPADSSWSQFGLSEGLPNRYVKCLLVTSSQEVWLGTSGSGLCHYTGLPFAFFDRRQSLPEQAVYALLEDRACRIWIGNGQRLVRMENDQFTDLSTLPGFRASKYKSIAQDAGGRIWVGTEGRGVALVTDSSMLWLDQTNGLPSDWVRSLAPAAGGGMWVGTASMGLALVSAFQDSNGTRWELTKEPIKVDGIQASLNQVLPGPDGRIWAATRNLGLLLRTQPGQWKPMLPDSLRADIRSMAFDESGKLWLGTADAGIIRLEPNDEKAPLLRIRDELSSQVVYLLAFDEWGDLWAGSERGMDRLILDGNGKLLEVHHFGLEEGFWGIETCLNAAMRDREGRMWFGTINGMGRWQAGGEAESAHPPQLSLNEIRLFYTPLNPVKAPDILGPWNEFIRPWVLSFRQNHVSFDLQGIDLKRPGEVLYQWRMIGAEDDWSPPSPRQTATYSNLAPGPYRFQAKAGFAGGPWTEAMEIVLEVQPPYWATWWFRLSGSALVLGLVLGIFRFRLNQVKQRADRDRQRLELERDLIELEQKALRLQMNPHFIFNALNSIQALIARQDPASSRYFLSKFSRLMRQVLENSRHARVSLAREQQVLEDYLALEKFSRGDSFDYEIQMEGELDPEEVWLPPMLLQPFLENAIIHGIASLSERRGLVVLTVREEGGELVCEVRDNGVGRQRARELGSQQDAQHKSMALEVTQERLERLAGPGRPVPLLVIEDLKAANGSAAGTRVVIRIPSGRQQG